MRVVLAVMVLLTACKDDSGAPVGFLDGGEIDMASPVCDVIAQTCATGKCTYVGVPDATRSCVAEGPTGRDQPCTTDTCAKGLFCSAAGVDTKYCRAFCRATADCGGSQVCLGLMSGDGVCAPTCDPFGIVGCAGGFTCAQLVGDIGGQTALVCRPPGMIAAGQTCASNDDCGAGLVCAGNPLRCTPLCDGGHACNAMSCTMIPGLPHGLGFCQ